MNFRRLLQGVICMGLVTFFIGGCGSAPQGEVLAPTAAPLLPTPMPGLEGKRALFVVPDRYREAEYDLPRSILEGSGAQVTVASWSLDELLGTKGNKVQPELQLTDVRTDDYDAIVMVGGDGVRPTEAEIQRIVREAIAGDKVVAAICGSQAILAHAGVVDAGGVATGTVERDGLIVTASGSSAAREFGTAIATLLAE